MSKPLIHSWSCSVLLVLVTLLPRVGSGQEPSWTETKVYTAHLDHAGQGGAAASAEAEAALEVALQQLEEVRDRFQAVRDRHRQVLTTNQGILRPVQLLDELIRGEIVRYHEQLRLARLTSAAIIAWSGGMAAGQTANWLGTWCWGRRITCQQQRCDLAPLQPDAGSLIYQLPTAAEVDELMVRLTQATGREFGADDFRAVGSEGLWLLEYLRRQVALGLLLARGSAASNAYRQDEVMLAHRDLKYALAGLPAVQREAAAIMERSATTSGLEVLLEQSARYEELLEALRIAILAAWRTGQISQDAMEASISALETELVGALEEVAAGLRIAEAEGVVFATFEEYLGEPLSRDQAVAFTRTCAELGPACLPQSERWFVNELLSAAGTDSRLNDPAACVAEWDATGLGPHELGKFGPAGQDRLTASMTLARYGTSRSACDYWVELDLDQTRASAAAKHATGFTDVTADRKITVRDVQSLVRVILSGEPGQPQEDVNLDGVVDQGDVELQVNTILERPVSELCPRPLPTVDLCVTDQQIAPCETEEGCWAQQGFCVTVEQGFCEIRCDALVTTAQLGLDECDKFGSEVCGGQMQVRWHWPWASPGCDCHGFCETDPRVEALVRWLPGDGEQDPYRECMLISAGICGQAMLRYYCTPPWLPSSRPCRAWCRQEEATLLALDGPSQSAKECAGWARLACGDRGLPFGRLEFGTSLREGPQ